MVSRVSIISLSFSYCSSFDSLICRSHFSRLVLIKLKTKKSNMSAIKTINPAQKLTVNIIIIELIA